MKKRFTFLLVLLFIGNALFAQNSTQGKEFWLSFMRNGYQYNGTNWVETQVMVSAKWLVAVRSAILALRGR